jgi:hypothetical protein
MGILLMDVYLAFRIHQTVNQDNWIHIAERIEKIINNGIERYRCVMGESDYQGFINGMNRTTGGAWHSKKILLDAIAYIMAGNDIKVEVEKFHKEEERAKEAGNPWTPSQRNMYYQELIKKATTASNTIATKVAPLLRPEYGDFIKKCGELYRETAKKRCLKSDSSTVLLTMDRARLFTNVNMDPNLCVALLDAHCLPKKRKEWFHPALSNDDPLKQWMFTWNMWAKVEMLARVMLDTLIDQVSGTGGLDLTKDIKDTKELLFNEFDKYTQKVKGQFFHSLWYLHYGCDEAPKIDVICKRAKGYVYRFFMVMEKVDTTVIRVYPACFQLWTKGVQNDKGVWTWLKDSMYPCKGKNEP